MRVGTALVLAALLASPSVLAQRAPEPEPLPPAYDAPPPAPIPEPPPEVAPAPPLPPPLSPPPGGVYVELRSTSPDVRIDRVVKPGLAVPVCAPPCRQLLSRDYRYVIEGNGVRPTSQFVLPDDRQELTLDVVPGSSAQRTTGAVLLLVGGGAAYVAFVAGSLKDTSANPTLVGAALLGGIAMAGIGIFLIASTHTTVTSSSGAVFTGAPAPARERRSPRVALTARGLEF